MDLQDKTTVNNWSVFWLYLKMWRTFWQQNKQEYLLLYRQIFVVLARELEARICLKEY